MEQDSLVLRKEDADSINLALINLLKASAAKCALLVEQSGKCIAKRGFTQKLDTDALAALIAGSFASTRAMAKLVGESDFSVLFHQGDKDHIHNILVDDNSILTVIFDERTTIGMVRLYSKDAAKQLRHVLRAARQRKLGESAAPTSLDTEAQKRLKDVLGD
jgi:predicted regulator of Ras-like GTPase activity (Roadblock/LC7/MglB family)